ncbi:hypothetical protein HYC85_025929 [Camellia sinensis]|uniref:Protein kinase domain-containing protein n=1 Tax=Camellia sinensis TaxID=4442 RepID=A0A7J7G249_CAMSI|nr:hypothetical protein HYC85_025929 [Camellia sinensis]
MDRYDIFDESLPGSQAIVLMAIDRLTNNKMALKKIFLPDDEIPRSAIREASLLFDLHHQNIVRLERVFVEEGFLYMVLEHVAMDLRVHMSWHDEKYPAVIKKFLKQILCGIAYCHSNGVLHRALKPDNLLIDTRSNTRKIADFGRARGIVSPDLMLTPMLATLNYRAPEILMSSEHYSAAVDMWSVGCIFAEMVMKEPLFNGLSEIDVLREIFRFITSINDLGAVLKDLEPAGLDLLSGLLSLDPERRTTAEAALGHEYLTTTTIDLVDAFGALNFALG